MTATIFDIVRNSFVDGPGIRTTVFFKGCPLRCIWCHNPEGLSPTPELYERVEGCLSCGLCRTPCAHEECKPFGRCLHVCPKNLVRPVGRYYEDDALAARLLRQKSFFDSMGGGITLSGGEPLLQADFMLAVMDRMPGIRFAMETSGYASQETFRKVVDRMSLVYMDLKIADPQKHKEYTGVDNAPILRNLEYLRGKNAVIRTPLIPGITDTEENLAAIKKLVGDLPHELLPYNEMADAKYSMLGMEYPLKKQ